MGAAKLLCLVLFFFAISTVQSVSLEELLTTEGLSTFLNLAKLAPGGIAGINNVTIFVPTDAAFSAVTIPQEEGVAAVSYHFVHGQHMLKDLGDNQLFPTNNQNLTVRTQVLTFPGVTAQTVNGKLITKGDLVSAEQNVVVHIINGVLYPIPTQTIGQMLAGEPTLNFTNGVLVQLKAITDILNDPTRNLTFFVPVDDVWATIDDKVKKAIDNHDLLINIFKYHIVPDVLFSTYPPLGSTLTLPTLQGGNITVATSETGIVTVNGAPLRATNALGTNGVYHSLENVLVPPFTVADDLIGLNYTSIYTKLNSTDAFNTLLNVSTKVILFTLPNDVIDAAGENLTADLLAYHVAFDAADPPTDPIQPRALLTLSGKSLFLSVLGEQLFVNGQPFAVVDRASNGVIGLLQTPLKPPAATVLDVLQDNAAVSAFFNAAKANTAVAEILGNLTGAYTLFAPSNDALLKHAGLSELLSNATFAAQLFSLHVAPAVAFAQTLAATTTVNSLAGDSLTLQFAENVITVNGPQNGAKSVQNDILGVNGVVHVIDDVLLPLGFVDPGTSAPTEAPTGATEAPTDAPTDAPTGAPTDAPTVATEAPTTAAPTTAAPTTAAPTTAAPTTAAPTTAAATTRAPTTAAATTRAPTTTTTTTTKSGASFTAPSFVFLVIVALFRLF